MERTVARLGCDCHFKKFPLVRVRLAYRERSDVMSISISAVISQDRFVECGIRSVRSRYCIISSCPITRAMKLCEKSIFHSGGNSNWSYLPADAISKTIIRRKPKNRTSAAIFQMLYGLSP